jgi:UDP-glucose 4-epimerase
MSHRRRVIVTGVSGYIGSVMAKRCLVSGYQVLGISRDNTELVSQELGVDVVKADLLVSSDLESIGFRASDIIIHCATANDILSKDFNAGVSLSVMGTKHLFESALRAGVRKLILFSTAQVYGTELIGVIDESSPVRCETPYALNHFFAEELSRFYSINNDFDVVVVRPSNVYGLPQISTVNRSTLVPMCFVEQVIEQGSIALHSSGKQTRNFVSTDEVADLILNVLDEFPEGFSIVNACSNYHASIFDIAVLVANSFTKTYKEIIPVNVCSAQPANSNRFQYKSRVFTPRGEVSVCKDNMINVIDQLTTVRLREPSGSQDRYWTWVRS